MPTSGPSVLFIITRGDSIGGAQIHVRDLARGAMSRGWRVSVAVGHPGVFIDALQAEGFEVHLTPGLHRSVNPFADWQAVGWMRDLIRRWKPSLVSCHTAKAGMVGRLAAAREHVPCQYTVHGWQFAEGIPFLQRAVVLTTERFLAPRTARIITVSEYDRQLALKKRVAEEERIITVRNGMPDRPAPPLRVVRDSVRLVMVARFQPQKDHRTLFSALERLESLPWNLDLVGDGPEESRWKTWVQDRGWSHRVNFHGTIDRVAEVLDQADVFVLASHWEGLPNSILEAMRAALPVVASDVGGVAEEVIPGETGFLVPPRDPSALAASLEPLIRDSSLRSSLGLRGRKRFEAHFTFEIMLNKTIAVWETLLGR